MKKILLLLSIIISTDCYAQWTTDTTMNTMVRDTLGATTPLMATRTDGSTYICWFETGAQNYELRMQLLDTNGYELWTPGGIVVSNYPQSTAIYRYDLKVDNDGNAIVAFQDVRTNGDLNVVVNKVTPSGTLAWGATGVQLIDAQSTEGLAPSIGISYNNYVYVAWNADNASAKWIAYQSISPAGSVHWANQLRIIDSTGVLKYSRPELFPTGNSIQMLFVEEAGTFPGVQSTMYTQRFDSAGINFFPSPVKVSALQIPYFFFPEPVPDDNGGFFVAFNTSNLVNQALTDVYVQYVDYNGTLWNADGIQAANSNSENKFAASACYISQLNEFFVLMQVTDAGQSLSGMSIQRYDGGGTTQLGANGLQLIVPSQDYYLPYTITDAGDGVIMSAGYGSFGQVHLFAEKTDYDGIILWPGVSVPLCAVNSNKDDIQSGKFVNNNLVFVWQDDRHGSGIFAQNIDGNGNPGIPDLINESAVPDFIVYPNPSHMLQLKFHDGVYDTIIIHDMSGRKIISGAISGSEFRGINLSPGMYVVTLTGAVKTKSFKWIAE